MKTPAKTRAQLTLFAALGLAAGLVHTQSSLTIYGCIDTGIRYSTHQFIDGGALVEISSGAASASRWGIKDSEDLDGGLKAIFTLENGFNPDTGRAWLQNC